MSLSIDGKGWSLRQIMKGEMYKTFTPEQLAELQKQLADAALNAGVPRRRAEYAKWNTLITEHGWERLAEVIEQEAA